LIAARAVDAVAHQFELRRIGPGIDLLVANDPPEFAGLAAFRIVDQVPLRLPSVRAALAAHDCGPLEIKKRGVDHRLMEPFQSMRFRGSRPLVLMLTRIGGDHGCLVLERIGKE
jgi:hypothetical protein